MSKTVPLFLLLLTSFAFMLPPIRAESTNISDLSYPSALSQDTLQPISVTANVAYKDAGPGYALVVGIIDMGLSPPDFASGVATSSPDVCVNQPILSAWCVSRPSATSGAEHLEFKIGGILGGNYTTETWRLNMTAALYNANNTLVESSVSSVPFTISVSPLTLTVVVPDNAVVSVDGVAQKPGPIQIAIRGGTHNLTAPPFLEVDTGARLRFDHWDDGPTDANRTITIERSESVEAIYVQQYRLSILGQTPSTIGEGWYDSGYTATFSVSEIDRMSGLLGVLGGRLIFQGWYENGKLISDSPVDSMIMNKPRTLTVIWQSDYTMPIVILGVLGGIGVVFAYLLNRRRSGKQPARERRETPRKTRRVRQRTRSER